MFNSQRINNDPFPYVSSSGSRHANPGWMGSEYFSNRQERKEYDNNPNPLLEYFRDAMGSGEYEAVALAEVWVGLIDSGYDWQDEDGVRVTPAHIDHARKVLERLVNVYSD